MPAKDLTRWKQNADGTWSRRYGDEQDIEKAYTDMSKPELQAQLEARGLPTSGNKPDLIERLEAAEAA